MLNRRGIALIVVLWIIVILEVIVGGLIYISRIQTKIITYQVKNIKTWAIAKGGMERALAYLYEHQKALELDPVYPETFPRTFSGFLDEGAYLVTVWNEEGKLNINTCPRESLETLLDQCISVNREKITSYVFNARTKGQRLLALRQLRQAGAISVQEMEKLAEFITTSSNGKLNLNTAPLPVIETVSDLSAGKALELVAYRIGNDRTPGTADDQLIDETKLKEIVGNSIYMKIKGAICYRGDHYRIVATGNVETYTKKIETFLHYDQKINAFNVTYWREE